MTSRRVALLTLVAGLAMTVTLGSQQGDAWIGFRYDADHVLFYAATLVDPVQAHDYMRLALAPPAARYGAGGYLLPLTAERLAAFRPVTPDPAEQRSAPPVGAKLRVMLGAGREVSCVVERYVEQWGSENPVVEIGVLGRIPSADLAAFRSAASGYFLVERAGSRPAVVDEARSPVQWKSMEIVNRLGARGDIRLRTAEAGWCVTLYVPAKGQVRPSTVYYCYGD